MTEILYSRFAVNDRPFCVWEWDLDVRNRRFIESIDPGFFEYIARSNKDALDGPDSQRAAVALRLSYSHGLEAFHALLFSTLQAPDCMPGWLAKYQLSDLRSLAKKVLWGDSFYSKVRLEEFSWMGSLPVSSVFRFRQTVKPVWSCAVSGICGLVFRAISWIKISRMSTTVLSTVYG